MPSELGKPRGYWGSAREREKLVRRLRAKFEKIIVDVQAAIPSS